MEINAQKQTYIVKLVIYTILFLGNIWYSVDSFCECAGTFKIKTLLSGIFFLAMAVYFVWQVISEYKLHKTK